MRNQNQRPLPRQYRTGGQSTIPVPNSQGKELALGPEDGGSPTLTKTTRSRQHIQVNWWYLVGLEMQYYSMLPSIGVKLGYQL